MTNKLGINKLYGGQSKSCINVNAYGYWSTFLSDKGWAFAIQENFPDITNMFGRVVRLSNVQQKNRPKEYQVVHNKMTIQINDGRTLEAQRECYFKSAISYYHERPRLVGNYRPNVTIWYENVKQDKTPDQKFIPSKRLIELVYRHMVRPDQDEIINLMLELKIIRTYTVNEKENIRTMITDQVEGFLTNLAKRTFYTAEEIKVISNNRFTPEVCSELIDRLGIDPREPRQVLDLLYDELLYFISSIPRERVWGKIFVENSEIIFEVKKNVFALPEFPNMEGER